MKRGGHLFGRHLGYYIDACGHVVYPHLALEIPGRKFPAFWAHSGLSSTCLSAQWAVDGYDPTPLPDGRIPEATDPTRRDEDIIGFEPTAPIKEHRNFWSRLRAVSGP